jgi:glutathione S-transferase
MAKIPHDMDHHERPGEAKMAITLYGFDGSTYVRTVRMLFAEKGAQYDQVPVHVLKGEPRQPEHLARHPFGNLPVVDHDGFRILETSAIGSYLDEVLPGPSFTPDNAKDRARMRMAIGIIDSYGYDALVGVAGYHLFPDFIGGKNEGSRQKCMKTGKLVLQELMKVRGDDNFIAGERRSLADFHLAPICATSRAEPSRSSRAMSDCCSVGGIAWKAPRSPRSSKSRVTSSTNSGTPPVRSVTPSITSFGSAWRAASSPTM